MILTIDASSTKIGGALSHLNSLVLEFKKKDIKIKKLIIWAPNKTLKNLPNANWILKKTHKLINSNLFSRILWQLFYLKKELIKSKTDIFFVSCGYYFINFKPTIVICQNFLPFDKLSLKKYRFSLTGFKLYMLRKLLIDSFKKAQGIIFLNKHITKILSKKILDKKKIIIIPHGITKTLKKKVFKGNKKLLYVSDFELYKNHLELFLAIDKLSHNYDLELTCVGNLNNQFFKLKHKMKKLGLINLQVKFINRLDWKKLTKQYINCDIFIFNSSSENFAITLVEAMSSRLPIIASNISPIKNIINKNGILVNPLNEKSIAIGLKKLLDSENLRKKLAKKTEIQARIYKTDLMALSTYKFLLKIIKDNK